MLVDVPQIVAEYLAAEREHDAGRLSLCFSQDGFVYDEGKYYRGPDAIRLWKEKVDAKYQYTSEFLAASVSTDAVKVRARLTGNFPGSPVEVHQVFELAGGKIISLEIQ